MAASLLKNARGLEEALLVDCVGPAFRLAISTPLRLLVTNNDGSKLGELQVRLRWFSRRQNHLEWPLNVGHIIRYGFRHR